MTAAQKHAWFTLAVLALSVLVVFALMPVMGVRRAMGGFGLLGMLGFGILFYRKRPGQVILDERDAQIQVRSLIISASIFWIIYVESYVFLPWIYYGQQGAVPVVVLQSSVWVAFIIFSLLYSIATLIQYGRGGSDAT